MSRGRSFEGFENGYASQQREEAEEERREAEEQDRLHAAVDAESARVKAETAAVQYLRRECRSVVEDLRSDSGATAPALKAQRADGPCQPNGTASTPVGDALRPEHPRKSGNGGRSAGQGSPSMASTARFGAARSHAQADLARNEQAVSFGARVRVGEARSSQAPSGSQRDSVARSATPRLGSQGCGASGFGSCDGVCNTPGEGLSPGGADDVHPSDNASILALGGACADDGVCRGSKVRSKIPCFSVVRLSLDWAKMLYDTYVSGQVFKWLEKHVRDGIDVEIQIGGTTQSLRVKEARGGIAMLGTGFVVLVRKESQYERPRSVPADPVKRINEQVRVAGEREAIRRQEERHYGVELEIQGRALSASISGFDVIDEIRLAVESLLFRHRGATEQERRDYLSPRTYPGRFDLACDVSISGDCATDWIDRVLYRRTRLDWARRDWVTRARCQRAVASPVSDDDGDCVDDDGRSDDVHGGSEVGKVLLFNKFTKRQAVDDDRTEFYGGSAGKTIYFGKNPMIRVYERDKHTADGHWGLLLKTLTEECLWDGKGRLVRVEWQVTRDWFRDQEFDGIRGDLLCFDDWVRTLPLIAGTLVKRFRHTTPGPRGTKTKQRPTSLFWKAVERAVEKFRMMETPLVTPFERIRSVKRARRLELGMERAARGIITVAELGDKDGNRISYQDAMVRVLCARLLNPQYAEGDAAFAERVRKDVFLSRRDAVPLTSAERWADMVAAERAASAAA